MQNQSIAPGNLALFQAYNDVWPCWPLIGMALLHNAVTGPGMAMNLCVIWVTMKTSSLRGTTNLLLALYSFFEMLNEAGNLLCLWTTISREHFVDYALALKLLCVPFFGLYASTTTMVLIGLDRLVAIFFPFKYKSMYRRTVYLGVTCTISALYAFTTLAFKFAAAVQASALKVSGFTGDMSPPNLMPIAFSYAALFLYGTTVAFYLLIGAKMCLRKQVSEDDDGGIQRRLLRTLFCIIIFNIGGYLLTFVYKIWISPHIVSPLNNWYLYQVCCFILNMSGASNMPILYLTSTEYRTAFCVEIGNLFNQRESNSINPTNTTHILQRQEHHRPGAQPQHAWHIEE